VLDALRDEQLEGRVTTRAAALAWLKSSVASPSPEVGGDAVPSA
jgi:hypothetical protein